MQRIIAMTNEWTQKETGILDHKWVALVRDILKDSLILTCPVMLAAILTLLLGR